MLGGTTTTVKIPTHPIHQAFRNRATPPLWGIRDSGPYLHDGRAARLQEAIIQHEGQAAQSRRGFRARWAQADSRAYSPS